MPVERGALTSGMLVNEREDEAIGDKPSNAVRIRKLGRKLCLKAKQEMGVLRLRGAQLGPHAAPTTPADPTGACVGRFPVAAAFPVSQAGRRPQLHFRGLLRHTARYGLTACSPGLPGLCREASARPVTGPRCSPASMSTDIFIGGAFHPAGCSRQYGALRNAG